MANSMRESVTETAEEAQSGEQGVSRAELLTQLKGMGKQGVSLAVKGALVYAGVLTGGLVLGGVAGGIVATYMGWQALSFLGATVAGIALGGLGGFVGAKICVGGMVEDFAVKNGLDLGDMGLREVLSLITKAKKSAPVIKKPLEALERTAGMAQKGVGNLKKWFGHAGKKSVEQDNSAPAATAQKHQLK